MKAILEFNLPEDEEEHKSALDSANWKFALQEFDDFLRGKIKHTDDKTIDLQLAREELHSIVNDRGLRFE